MLRELFKKTFDIRDGEIRISFFMQIYIFLLITVLLMVKPTINALFLSKLGADHLPYGYVLVAVVAVVTSMLYNRAVKKYSLRRIAIFTLVGFSLVFGLLSILMFAQLLNDWVLYIYYLSVSLFAVLATSQFWILANMVYNAREAKRLFGFIGAGAIAGGIFGGYLTTALASAFGNKIVILIASILILCCIPMLQAVWRQRIKKMNSYVRSQRKTSEQQSYDSPFKLIIKSKHLTLLAAIVGVGVIIAKLVDFQFSDFANRAIPDSDELASFFGFWFSTFNVLALLIQLFLTNRMVSWLGVTSNLLILPLGIAIGCLLFLTFPELWVLVIIKGMDGSFKQSLNKAGIELSILPIPYHIKNEAKAFIDVVVDSIATGLAGLMLIFVVRRLELSTSYITIIILLFLFAWIVLIYKLRETYFESFRINIQNSLVNNKQSKKKISTERSSKSTIQILTQGSEEEIVKLLNRLQDYRLKTLEPFILKLLDHPSNKVKAAAIDQMYSYRKGTAVQKVKELIQIEDDVVVYKAMEYLLNHTQLNDQTIFNLYLDHEVNYISNAALLCLAKETSENHKLSNTFNLNTRVSDKIRELSKDDADLRKEEIAELLITVAYANQERFYSFISAHFNNKDPYVIKYAIRAAGITAHEPFVGSLIDFLVDKDFRKSARIALKSYGMGITKTILSLDISESLNDDVKPHIPKVIELFKSRDSVKILLRLLRSKDFIIRLEAAKSLNILKTESPNISIDQGSLSKIILKESAYYRNTINAMAIVTKLVAEADISETTSDFETELLIAREGLLEILHKQLDQSLECVFKLLSLKYDQIDIDTAYYGLKSEVRETKINSVEFLDNLLKSRLKTEILPLIEYHIIDNNKDGLSSFDIKALTEKEALLMLLKNRGSKMKLAVLNVIKETEDPTYIKRINKLKGHKNKRVRRSLNHTIAMLKSATKTTSQ